jgi:hypothetical protein
MTEAVRIPSRYCGPPDSANGGYTCGIAAGAIGGTNVEVTLHAPPPLDRTMELQSDGAEASLVEAGTVIATARPTEEPVDIPADAPLPPPYEDVAAAAAIFDVDAYRHRHEYPTCFTCGPDRAVGDGLRIFPAPTDRADRRAWPWTPDASVLTDAGTIEVPVIWAALDCPSGLAWLEQDPSLEAIVLGKMAAVIHRLPAAGEHLIVCGWTEAAEGRRRPARSAMFDASGAVVAASRATWVVLTAEQRRAFRSRR